MSIFRVYSPKSLYRRTLVLTNVIFNIPPAVSLEPASYFKATIEAHRHISNDLSSVLPVHNDNTGSITITKVYNSLLSLEKTLFGTKSEFKASVEGCCLYTDSLTNRLRSQSTCSIH
jgi:hypothetical protein